MTDHPPTKLTSEQKDAFKHARPPARPPLTAKDKVRAVLGEIREKRNAGWSYEEVRQELAKTMGFKGTLQTLYRYVWQLSTGQTQPNAPTAPNAGPPDQQAATLRIPPESAPAQRAGEPKPNLGRFIQNLGGEHARAARQQAKEAKEAQANSKPKSLVDRLNDPL